MSSGTKLQTLIFGQLFCLIGWTINKAYYPNYQFSRPQALQFVWQFEVFEIKYWWVMNNCLSLLLTPPAIIPYFVFGALCDHHCPVTEIQNCSNDWMVKASRQCIYEMDSFIYQTGTFMFVKLKWSLSWLFSHNKYRTSFLPGGGGGGYVLIPHHYGTVDVTSITPMLDKPNNFFLCAWNKTTGTFRSKV